MRWWLKMLNEISDLEMQGHVLMLSKIQARHLHLMSSLRGSLLHLPW